MKVSEWLARYDGKAVTVRSGCAIAEVLEWLLAESCRRDLYVVDDDDRLLGHLSHKRLAEHVLAEHRPAHTRRQLMERVSGGTADDLMDGAFARASPDEELEDVLHRQLEHEIEDMPVIDGAGRLLGAINLTRVLQELVRADAVLDR
jgi:CBS-domain-containing membrane protein